MVPLIVAGIAGASSFLLLGLLGGDKPTIRPEIPLPPVPRPTPAPAPRVTAPAGPADLGGLNPGVLPLDADGFPQQATMQFLQDNNLQERVFGPILESTPERQQTFQPAAQDRFTSPQGFEQTEQGGDSDGGEFISMDGFDSDEPEEEGFFDSLF
jgi:hypothetical protein